jgi:hypothetical protein
VKKCEANIKITFMKKMLTLLVVALSAATITHAQLQRGNVLVGGDLAGFQFVLNSGGAYDINIEPKAAWFISDNVAVGAQVQLGISGAKNANTVFTYGIGPIARYYVNSAKVNLLQHGRWFFEGNAGIAGYNVQHGASTNGLNLGIGPGYAYFITPNVGLETLLKYNGTVGFGNTTTTSDLQLNVGFQIYLPGRATRDKIMRDETK